MFFSRTKAVTRITHLQKRVETLEKRLSLATQCLEEISKGNFEIDFDYHAKEDDAESKLFASTFLKMKSRLSEYAQQEQERKWATDGLAKFMALSRNETKGNFYDKVLSFIVQYTQANQGALFLLNNLNPADLHLELISCYAYSKKKFVEKRIEIGQGILGQCFLEKATCTTAEVPPFYTTITSGLGEATPRFLLLVPLKYNNEVLGIIEMAYFAKVHPYQVEFVEKIAENIATVTLNTQHSKRTELLYEESQQKAQTLREQEETLRQNVEELTATQEEMKRNQAELDRQTQFQKFVLDNIPFPVFVKDERGCYTLVNRAEARLFNLEEKAILGKDDRHFVGSEKEWKQIKESDERALNSAVPIELPMQRFTTVSGESYIFNTTKISFVNKVTGRKNILGVSIDITEKLKLEQQWLREKDINRHNNFINVAGRQRMLSQKIGFYAEALLRGKRQFHNTLRHAIELYEHSLQVIRFGGMPIAINCKTPLPPLHDDLLPQIKEVESLWSVYKEAAENILNFSSQEKINNSYHNIEHNISFIEENAEKLLTLNNDLILAYLQVHTESMEEIVA